MERKIDCPVLDVFDIVELRDGRLAVVLPISEVHCYEEALGLYSRAYTHIPRIADVSEYNDDLKYNSWSSNTDIMKVLKYSQIKENSTFSYEAYIRMLSDIIIRRGLYWDDFKTFENQLNPLGWTWERDEVKEVTMDDIEKQFGCKIKIVKEVNDGK